LGGYNDGQWPFDHMQARGQRTKKYTYKRERQTGKDFRASRRDAALKSWQDRRERAKPITIRRIA
jgi:hypothetical protein